MKSFQIQTHIELLEAVKGEVRKKRNEFEEQSKITLGFATLKEAHDYGYHKALSDLSAYLQGMIDNLNK